ncbi:hypothetical protein Dimus_007356 [Dionaea muscipula]
MDLTYMDHLMARRLVNLPRVMMRHMSYVISMKDHELPYEIGSLWFLRHSRRRGRKRRRKSIGFDWEAVIDEVAIEGESGSGEKFYDAEDENQGSPEVQEEIPKKCSIFTQEEDKEPSGVDPSGPTGREAEFLKFQAEFERKRANRFHDDLEKVKAENARLLALLHQAQIKPHP